LIDVVHHPINEYGASAHDPQADERAAAASLWRALDVRIETLMIVAAT